MKTIQEISIQKQQEDKTLENRIDLLNKGIAKMFEKIDLRAFYNNKDKQ